jgi:hypothetical protein
MEIKVALGRWPKLRRTSGSIVESFVCKAVEVKPSCSLEPTLEVIVLQLISARLSDFVLGGGVR